MTGRVLQASHGAQVRRNTLLLMVAQVALWGMVGAFVANAPPAIVALAGARYWAGVIIAAYSVSLAVGAAVGGRAMDRFGRRLGLAAGWIALVIGGALISGAVFAGWWPALLAGTAVLGAGAGTAFLSRVAVAEMHPARSRGRAVGMLLLVGTAGAVGGPPAVDALRALGGEAAEVLPWLAVLGLGVVGVASVLAIRVDPSELAVTEDAGSSAPGEPRRTFTSLLRVPPFLAAVAAVVVSQMAMVAIMGVSTLVVHDHGGSSATSSILISLHLGAMFAFSPLLGALMDRYGRRIALLGGAAVSIAGALLTSLADGSGGFGIGLILVGLGWSGAFLGATTVVADVTTTSERAGVLGVVDLLTHAASAVGALTGGFLLDWTGFPTLGLAMAALIAPALILVARLRERSPGAWAEG